MALNGMTPTPERVKDIDMTSPMVYDNLQIMIKWPEEMSRWAEVARPFDNTVISSRSSYILKFQLLIINNKLRNYVFINYEQHFLKFYSIRLGLWLPFR